MDRGNLKLYYAFNPTFSPLDDCVDVSSFGGRGLACVLQRPLSRASVRPSGLVVGVGGFVVKPPYPPPPPRLALAGLHAQLLTGGGQLLVLGLGAGVRAAVEGRHGAAFGVGVEAAVRRRVAGLELRGALHLLQSAHLLLQQGVLPFEVVDVLLVCVVFPPHVLDVLCGFV